LLAGDVIQKIAEQAIATAEDVQTQVAQSRVGQPLSVTVFRKGKSQTLSVSPGEFPVSQ
jgi:S1-C subfamily serine protease